MIDRQFDLAGMGEAFTPAEVLHFATHWPYHARAGQLAPDGDWSVWLLLGGRGAGKTHTGAEWIAQQVRDGARSVALVAPTLHDAREVMLGGDSGLLSIGHPSEQPSFQPTRRRLLWPNGAVGYLFSAEEPDRLRGPQFDCAWADEFCAWPRMADALSNLRLSLRLGSKPRLVISTTPRPVRALDDLIAAPDVVVTRARTIDNAAHLSPDFVRAMQRAYGGTALG